MRIISKVLEQATSMMIVMFCSTTFPFVQQKNSILISLQLYYARAGDMSAYLLFLSVKKLVLLCIVDELVENFLVGV
jgi:hypothetical protein